MHGTTSLRLIPCFNCLNINRHEFREKDFCAQNVVGKFLVHKISPFQRAKAGNYMYIMYFWCPVTFQFWYINWKQNCCSIFSVRSDDQKWQEDRELNFFFLTRRQKTKSFSTYSKWNVTGRVMLVLQPATTPRPALMITHHPSQWATEACMERIVRNMNAIFHFNVYLVPRHRKLNNLPRLPHTSSWRRF